VARGRAKKPSVGAWIGLIFLMLIFGMIGAYIFNNYLAGKPLAEVGIPQSQPPAQPQPAAGVPFCQTGGTVDWTLSSVWAYDESDIDNWGTAKVYHTDWTYAKTLTDDTETSFELYQEDNCKVYLVLDYGTNTAGFVDVQKTMANNPIYVETGVKDVDNDGFKERWFLVDLSKLSRFQMPLSGGETSKKLSSSLYLIKAQTSGDLVNVANITSVSTSAYNYYTVSNYFSGWSGHGYGLKLVYVKITLPNSGNASYADPANSYIQLRQVTIGGNDYLYTFGTDAITQTTSSYAYDTWLVDVGVPSTNQPEEGKWFVHERMYSDNWMSVTLQFYAKFPATNKVIQPTITLTFVKPDGTTFTVTQTFKLSS